MKEFRKQFLRRCRVEYKPFSSQMAKLKLSSLKALKWIITISNIHLRDHDDFKESWKKNQHSRNVFITKKHKSLPQPKRIPIPSLVFSSLFLCGKPGTDLPLLIAREAYGMELSDEDVAKLLAKDIDQHKSKAR